jgi:EmrB/QacA subfamily drug resistance transporter
VDDVTPLAPTTALTGTKSPRRRVIFSICAMAILMGSIDSTIVMTALPKIGSELHSRLNWTGWVITMYSLGMIIALPIAGKISDQFGRKRVFLICVVLFTVSSLACGLSVSIYMLVPLRLVQALGGGAFMPSAAGIIGDQFGNNRDRGIGAISSIVPIGQITGPVVGGVITQFWIWRGIFFVNVPIGIALFLLAAHYIPKTRPREREHLDFLGISLLATTIVAGMLAMTQMGEKGMSITNMRVVGPAILCVGLGWLFARHTRRAPMPFIPARFFYGPGFAPMNVLNFFYGTALVGFAALVPLYAENRYHIPISHAGTLMAARAVGAFSIAGLSTMLLRRVGYRLPMLVGFLVVAFGMVMISISPMGLSPYWWVALFSLVVGLGVGCAAPATNNATLQLAPDNIAAITGLRGMFRQIGGIIYVSLATALLARSIHPGLTQAHIFVVQAIILVIMASLIRIVPDHRGTW